MKEQFQTLLLLGYPGEGLYPLTNHLERKGWEPFNKGSVFQPCKTVSLCQAQGFCLLWTDPQPNGRDPQLCLSQDLGKGGMAQQAGGTEARSWGSSGAVAQRALLPLCWEFTHLGRNRNGESESGGMGEAGEIWGFQGGISGILGILSPFQGGISRIWGIPIPEQSQDAISSSSGGTSGA